MEVYKKRSKTFSAELTKINKKYNTISFFRLLSIVLFLLTLYYYFQTEKSFLIVLGVLFFAFFIILMRFHTKLVFQKELREALVAINNDEASYLNREKIPFENGQEFNNF